MAWGGVAWDRKKEYRRRAGYCSLGGRQVAAECQLGEGVLEMGCMVSTNQEEEKDHQRYRPGSKEKVDGRKGCG